jgi:hypothetical protein
MKTARFGKRKRCLIRSLFSTFECFSAWTLNSYIRKFESLQEELIKAQAQEQARYEENLQFESTDLGTGQLSRVKWSSFKPCRSLPSIPGYGTG